MSNSRRQFIKTAGGVAAGSGALALSACSSPTTPLTTAADPVFQFGVASGDPLADRVILWTHISVPNEQLGSPVAVSWKMASDPDMLNIVRTSDDGQDNSQPTTTDGVLDYTYKIDVNGLSAATSYYYQFEAPASNRQLVAPEPRPAATPTNCVSLYVHAASITTVTGIRIGILRNVLISTRLSISATTSTKKA